METAEASEAEPCNRAMVDQACGMLDNQMPSAAFGQDVIGNDQGPQDECQDHGVRRGGTL